MRLFANCDMHEEDHLNIQIFILCLNFFRKEEEKANNRVLLVHTFGEEAQENHWERLHGPLMQGTLVSSAAPNGQR